MKEGQAGRGEYGDGAALFAKAPQRETGEVRLTMRPLSPYVINELMCDISFPYFGTNVVGAMNDKLAEKTWLKGALLLLNEPRRVR